MQPSSFLQCTGLLHVGLLQCDARVTVERSDEERQREAGDLNQLFILPISASPPPFLLLCVSLLHSVSVCYEHWEIKLPNPPWCSNPTLFFCIQWNVSLDEEKTQNKKSPTTFHTLGVVFHFTALTSQSCEWLAHFAADVISNDKLSLECIVPCHNTSVTREYLREVILFQYRHSGCVFTAGEMLRHSDWWEWHLLESQVWLVFFLFFLFFF